MVFVYRGTGIVVEMVGKGDVRDDRWNGDGGL